MSVFSFSGQVAFVGSRSFSCAASVRAVLLSVLAVPSVSVRVGCCVGADALVLSQARALGLVSRVSCFAAFGAQAQGAFAAVSAVSAVSAFFHAGGCVQFLAGGSLRLPLARRLAARSAVVCSRASALVAFCSSFSGASFALASRFASRGLPVFVVSPVCPPALPSGVWVSFSGFSGVAAWQFVADALLL